MQNKKPFEIILHVGRVRNLQSLVAKKSCYGQTLIDECSISDYPSKLSMRTVQVHLYIWTTLIMNRLLGSNCQCSKIRGEVANFRVVSIKPLNYKDFVRYTLLLPWESQPAARKPDEKHKRAEVYSTISKQFKRLKYKF